MGVHRAAHAFGGVAEQYDRGRPGYGDEAVAWLEHALALGPGRTVLDLAAGTGKLTCALARTHARVLAVEPSLGMLDRLRAALPDVEAQEGTAEHIPLHDGSVDAVTVAQAFHWFANDEALAEMHRVLRPEGRLALVWNRRPLEAEVHAELQRIMSPHRGDAPRHAEGAWREPLERTDLFEALASTAIEFTQQLGVDALVDRALSTSFIAALPEGARRAVAAEVESVGRRLGEPIEVPYVTEMLVYGRR